MSDDTLLAGQKILNIFGSGLSRQGMIKAEADGLIPKATRIGSNSRRVWGYEDLPAIGERYGFLQKLEEPTVVTAFSTKGGAFKTTISLNLARVAALHNIKTLVIGLDMQCDITSDLGLTADIDENDSLTDALEKLSSIYGLEDFCRERLGLKDLIEVSDIPNLHFIPETPALTQLDKDIASMDFKELWLKNKVVEPLKKDYDLIIIDCSPNWNNLITNALIASDLVISPLECKIKHFRNFPYFKTHIESFIKSTGKSIEHIYVATKYARNKKLSREIKNWYFKNVTGCLTSTIRESTKVEEACACLLSIVEHAPTDLAAQEMRDFISEVWEIIVKSSSATQGQGVALADKISSLSQSEEVRV